MFGPKQAYPGKDRASTQLDLWASNCMHFGKRVSFSELPDLNACLMLINVLTQESYPQMLKWMLDCHVPPHSSIICSNSDSIHICFLSPLLYLCYYRAEVDYQCYGKEGVPGCKSIY